MKFITRCAATSSPSELPRGTCRTLKWYSLSGSSVSGSGHRLSCGNGACSRLDALVVLNSDGKGSAHPRNGAGQIKATYLAHLVPDVDQRKDGFIAPKPG